MFGFVKKLFDPAEAAIREAKPDVTKILALEGEISKMSTEKMRKRVEEMRKELKPLLDKVPMEAKFALNTITELGSLPPYEADIKNKLHELLPELFALVREVNNRKFNKKHFEVQLIAGVILAKGHSLTELKTGEGKTQVFHLPAALYGITGRGSHVVTVNDYLARRDGEHGGHALSDLGITVGIITPQTSYKFIPDDKLEEIKGAEAAAERKKLDISKLSNMKGVNLIECEKREAYACDVVFGTNNEFGFDYLRDNMAYELSGRVQRELYYCIVDEADSILIDEARTPLIISSAAEASNDLYEQFAKITPKLTADVHYEFDEKEKSVTLTEKGVEYVEQLLHVSNLWEDYRLAHHLDNALKAQVMYKADDEYIVKDGEILIVDEFTGRVLPGRRYSEGLHQAIEAKEGVEIKRESRTLATITFQNFFKLYKILAGGSGTIITEAEEFNKIYNLESYAIPTNRNVIRKDLNDKIYKNREAKFRAVAEEIADAHAKGQPILVGTTSIEDSEYLSGMLDKKGVIHEVLNAKYHEREAQIVAKAGEMNGVTVATNMAGRGTDIPLGEGADGRGGLYVIGTQRHEARRIDNQLRGRSGRQGEPGTSQFFVALDDEIMRIQGGDIVQKLMTITKIPDDIPIQNPLINRSIESAQKKMEGYNFDIRKRLVDYDNVMNQQREIFYTRRFNLLHKVNQSQDADKKIASDKTTEIKKEISDLLQDELDVIISKHMGEDDDKVDRQKLAQEFLDLADDEKIIEIVNKKAGKNNKGFSDSLMNLIDVKSAEKTRKNLEEILDQLAEKKIEDFGKDLAEIYKITVLQVMDENWTEHLDVMGDLREGIGLRGYAQRDPLVEYKNEAFTLFEGFVSGIDSLVARRVLKIKRVNTPRTSEKLKTNEDQIEDILTGTREMTGKIDELVSQGRRQQQKVEALAKTQGTVKGQVKVGRNDPCPCGSGLKYKKCGLINSSEHQKRMHSTS